MNPLVSVIIPTYNRAALLRRALHSVAMQTFHDFEVIVVDDGSTDKTQEIVAEWSSPQPLIFLASGKNKGVSAARNEGAKVSRGLWLAFLDSDDEWHSEKLRQQMEYARQNPAFSLIHCDEKWVRNGVPVAVPQKYQKTGGWIFEKSLEVCAIGPSTVLMKKNIFTELGGFREDFPVCEDYQLWLKITSQEEIGHVPHKLVTKHGGHADQLSRGHSLDYYRIKAIDEVLITADLKPEWREKAVEILGKKCEILIKGYIKHSNQAHYNEVFNIKETWCSHRGKRKSR